MSAEIAREPVPPTAHTLRVPRRVVIAAVVTFSFVAGAALFGAGYIAGDSSTSSSSTSVEAKCSTDEILRTAREWTDVQRRFYAVADGAPEEQRLLDEASTEDDHLEATFFKCFP
jgi:hypothetical protein